MGINEIYFQRYARDLFGGAIPVSSRGAPASYQKVCHEWVQLDLLTCCVTLALVGDTQSSGVRETVAWYTAPTPG